MRLSYCDKFASWERIRYVGELPLFGISYATLATLAFVFGGLSLYNFMLADLYEKISPTSQAFNIIRLFRPYLTPISDWMLLFAAVTLAAASTVYRVVCPPRVKENTLTYWIDSLDKPALHYMALAWAHRRARIACFICYLIGGALAICVFVEKLTNVVKFMWRYAAF